MDNNNKTTVTDKVPSLLTTTSWAMFFFFMQLMTGIFDVFLIYFYNVNLKLNIVWVTAAFAIYTIWDALNEPIIGFLTDRVTKYTKTMGKRTPWIVLGAGLAIFGFVLTYLPPTTEGNAHPVILFLWMILSICIYDAGLTMCTINVGALFPDKFRTKQARHKIQSWTAPIALMALPVAAMLPGALLMNSEDPSSYTTFAILAGVILIVTFVMSIYGLKEDKSVIARYYENTDEIKESFFKAIKNCFHHKAWVMMVVIMWGYYLLISSLQSSIPYFLQFVLKSDNSMILTFMMAGMVMGGVIASPLWSMLIKKLDDNKKAYIIAGIALALTTFLSGFIVNDLTGIIYITLYGCAMGAFWILNNILLADVWDDRVVRFKTTQRGAAVGMVAFMQRFSKLLMIGMVAFVQLTTGFDPELAVQTESATFGIRLQMGIMPSIIFLILLIVWAIFYPLTKEKTDANKRILEEMNL